MNEPDSVPELDFGNTKQNAYVVPDCDSKVHESGVVVPDPGTSEYEPSEFTKSGPNPILPEVTILA